MAGTFRELWQQLALEYSGIDPLLCRQFTLDAYKRACTNRAWGFLRADGQLLNQASRQVTVGVTQASATITSAAAFTAGDQGRQFRVGGLGIPWTLTFVDTSTCTLDRAYQGETDAAASGTVLDAYVTLPEDFDSFRSLVNPTCYRPMPWMLSREVLDNGDPNRTAQDSSARMLVSFQMSAQQVGRLLYEWWPYATARNVYPMTYYKRVDNLADTAVFVGVLSTRSEELLSFARYRASLYPGTVERKNPAYNPAIAKVHLDEWRITLEQLARIDDDHFMQSIELIDWRWVMGGLPYDSGMLRASDASGYATWGGAGGYMY